MSYQYEAVEAVDTPEQFDAYARMTLGEGQCDTARPAMQQKK